MSASIAHRLDTERLELGGGLEVLLSAALERVAPGEVLEVRTPSKAVALELPGWARMAGHAVVGEAHGDGGWTALVRRGASARVMGPALPARRAGPALRAGGELHTGDWRQGDAPPAHADPAAGLAPIGALAEPAPTDYAWTLNDRDALWADDLGELAEQASAQQWDASSDVPWEAARGLPDDVERAVAQVMTYIAQNEYAALYVPASFVARVNPQLPELLLWLASHVHDEARHVEVFTKRSLAGGQAGYALASTELSLATLLDERHFTSSALLLNVLGEGTFLDLLKFIARHAPDAATAAAARLAHRDERRHVHFGVSHVGRVLRTDPDARLALVAAAENRAAKLVSLTGLSPMLLESLTVLASDSLAPADLAEGAARVRALLTRMDRNRVRRLLACGFDAATARHLSDLHTPNLM